MLLFPSGDTRWEAEECFFFAGYMDTTRKSCLTPCRHVRNTLNIHKACRRIISETFTEAYVCIYKCSQYTFTCDKTSVAGLFYLVLSLTLHCFCAGN